MGRPELGQPRGAQGAPVALAIGHEQLVVNRVVIDLTNARDKVPFELAGAWLWAQDSSGTDASLDVYFNQPSGDPMTFKRGQRFASLKFHKLYLTNAAQAGKSLTLHYSMQPAEIENSVAIAGITEVLRPATFAAAAVSVGAAAASVLAADGSRYRATIQSPPSNTALVAIGTSNAVTLSNGIVLEPGGPPLVIQGTGAIWAIAGAASQSVRYFSEAT